MIQMFQVPNAIYKTWFAGGMQVNEPKVQRPWGVGGLWGPGTFLFVWFWGWKLTLARLALCHWLPVTSQPWVSFF